MKLPGLARAPARSAFCALVSLCIAGGASPAAVADAPADAVAAAQRPRIGLVLGGGGARGAAHVGVLKVLNELNVPIDAIVGTSMGAIVGGLYASGLSVGEVEAIVRDADWTRLLTDRPPRPERTFRRKSDDLDFLVNFDVGLGKGGRLILPRGIVQGQNFDLELRRHLLPVATINDFNALPIPFRAVATDIVHGTEVAIGSGDLASAIRASMSAPGIFKPVRYEGRLLVDGGVANNLPVDVARALGADIIIAVDVGFRLLPEEQLDSALKITNQMLTVLINGRARAQLELLESQDMLIEPSLGDIGSQEFGRIPEAIASGERAARNLAARLAPLGLSPGRFAARAHAVRDTRIPPPPVIDHIEVRNESRLSTDVLLARIDQHIGEPLDADALANSISDIYGFDSFETIDYRLAEGPRGTTLSVDATEKSWGPNFLRFGINLEDDFEGTSNYNVAARLTRMELNSLGGELRADLQIGTSPRLALEFFQPLDRAGRWFLNPLLQIGRSNDVVFFAGDRRLELVNDEVALSLQGGRIFSNTAELRVALTRSINDSRVYIGDPTLVTSAPNLTSIGVQFIYDTLDNVAIPRSGTTALAGWSSARTGLGSDLDVDVLEAFVLKPQTWGRNTLLHWWTLQSTVNTGGNDLAPMSLGGLFSLSGLAQNEIDGRHAGIGRLLYYRRLGADKAPGLGMQLYVGASLEVGNVWQRGADIGLDNTLVGGSAFVIVDTPLGPIYAAYGATEGGNRSAWLFLGQTF